jgi:hypothetical protein
MGLKTLEGTKLSLQGALSGASDVTSAGVVKKFALGGFADQSNGIVNNAFTAPLTYVPGSKNTTIHAQIASKNNPTVVVQENNKGEPLVNNKYAINSSMPEPLAVFSFTGNEIPALGAAIYQAYFEDKCSLEFSKTLIKKINQDNDKFLGGLLGKVKEETAAADSNLSLVEQYLAICRELDRLHNTPQQQMLGSLSAQKLQLLEPDALGRGGNSDRGGNNSFSLLEYAGMSNDVLMAKSNTAVMAQQMHIAARQMKLGASPLILAEKSVHFDDPNSVKMNFVSTTFKNYDITNLQKMSMANNTQQSFVYPSIEDASYTSRIQLYSLDSGAPSNSVQKVAYLMTLLSNEMAISTGLGRLENTQLGQAFGSSGDYVKNFWGADPNAADITSEATSPGCLSDFFVVGTNGNNRLSTEDGVMLFDGTKQKSTKNRQNVFDAFVAGSIKSPTSADANKVQELSSAHAAAIARYNLGAEFYKQLHCRGKNDQGKQAKLLTPRGLFTRLLSDFIDSLSLFQSAESAKGIQVRELCVLSVLGKLGHSDSNTGLIKRSLLGVMSKKALQLQYGLSTTAAKVSNKEAQKSKSTPVTTKVEVDDGDKKTTTTVTSENITADNTSQTNSPAFNPNPKNPRLCFDENKLFQKRSNNEINANFLKVFAAFASLPVSQKAKESSFTKIDLDIRQYYEEILSRNDGFLDKLVKIYTDICEESLKFLGAEGKLSAVNAERLTKNAQLDGTLMMALLLESACMLATEFVSAGISPDSTLQTAVAESEGIDKESVVGAAYFFNSVRITLEFQAGENTLSTLAVRTLGALCKASDNNDLISVFLPKNGKFIIPEAGIVSENDPISYSTNPISVAAVVDTLYDLAFERDLPAMCLSNVSGMIDYFDAVSSKYKDMASQLLGKKERTEEIKRLVKFSSSPVGKDFFLSLNDFSLAVAREKLNYLQQEIKSPSGRNPKISLGELRCIQTILGELQANPHTNNFVVTCFPKDYVTKSLMSSYSVGSDRSNPLKDEVVIVDVLRTSTFSGKLDSSTTRTLIRSPFSADSFSIFDNASPVSSDNIIDSVMMDTGDTGAAFLKKKIDPVAAKKVLKNELHSYLLKRLFSTLSSADLFASNISDYDVFPVDQNAAAVAKVFAQAYGLSPSVFDKVFLSSPISDTKYINEDALTDLARQDFDISASSVDVVTPPLKFGEAELFYDVFETVYFQSGAVEKRIFAVPLLDETVGLLLSPPQDDGSEQKVTMNGLVNASGVEKSLANQAAKKQVPSFDTYSVFAGYGFPLVNK